MTPFTEGHCYLSIQTFHLYANNSDRMIPSRDKRPVLDHFRFRQAPFLGGHLEQRIYSQTEAEVVQNRQFITTIPISFYRDMPYACRPYATSMTSVRLSVCNVGGL